MLARVYRVVEEKEKKDARREARASVRASRAKAGPPLRLPSGSGSSSDEMSENLGEGQLVDESISDPCQRPWDLRKASSRRSCHSSCGHSSCDPSSCESTGFDSRGTWWRAGCSKPSVGSDDGPRGADCSYLWASPCKPQLRAPRSSEATSSATGTACPLHRGRRPQRHWWEDWGKRARSVNSLWRRQIAAQPLTRLRKGPRRWRRQRLHSRWRQWAPTKTSQNLQVEQSKLAVLSSNSKEILRFEAFCCKGLPL